MTATALHDALSARRGRARGIAVAAATVAPAVVWAAAGVLGTALAVQMPGQPTMVIGLPVVLTTALAASLAGWAALALLERLTSRSRAAWTVLAGAALLASLGPIFQTDATAATRLVLVLMHIAVASVLIPALRRTTAA